MVARVTQAASLRTLSFCLLSFITPYPSMCYPYKCPVGKVLARDREPAAQKVTVGAT